MTTVLFNGKPTDADEGPFPDHSPSTEYFHAVSKESCAFTRKVLEDTLQGFDGERYSLQSWVTLARMLGLPVTGLCGTDFVPRSDPTKGLKACPACKDAANSSPTQF